MSVDTPHDSGIRPSGTSTLEKIARACVRHRWIVIGAWVAALVIINTIAGAVGPDYRTDFTLPASETKQVQELLAANSPDRAGFTGQIVFRAPQGVDDPDVQAVMNELFDYVAGLGDITVTSPYDSPQQISKDGTIAFAQLGHRRHAHLHRTDRHRQRHRRPGRPAQHSRRSADRVRRRPVRDVRASRERGLRPHRGRDHPHPRVRLGAGHGPADRHRPVRPRHRVRAGVAGQQRDQDARLHDVDGGDDRPRRRHRLRAVHRHPISREPQARRHASRTRWSRRSTPADAP